MCKGLVLHWLIQQLAHGLQQPSARSCHIGLEPERLGVDVIRPPTLLSFGSSYTAILLDIYIKSVYQRKSNRSGCRVVPINSLPCGRLSGLNQEMATAEDVVGRASFDEQLIL
jgi:hypothetical protein